jgi:hypothetical protein
LKPLNCKLIGQRWVYQSSFIRGIIGANIDIISKKQDGRLRGYSIVWWKPRGSSGFMTWIQNRYWRVVTYKNSTYRKFFQSPGFHNRFRDRCSIPVAGSSRENAMNLPLFHSLHKVADILSISLFELARLTTDNASEVFRKKG